MGVLVILSLGVAAGTLSGHHASRSQRRRSLVNEHAQDYLERCFAIPFGASSSPKASGVQLSNLFDENPLLGTATLQNLRAFGPIEFIPASAPGVPTSGRWRILVTNDLNLDGDSDDEDEGRADLLLVRVEFDGALVAEAVRLDPLATG
jgi:hypothetical protein